MSCPGICQTLCSPLQSCCSNVGNSFKQFTERPLSTYVVVSFVVSGVSCYLAYSGLQSPLPENSGIDTPDTCSSNFLYIVVGFAVVNIIFAWFLQNQVWREIMNNRDAFIDGDAPTTAYKGALPQSAMGALGSLAEATGKKELLKKPAAAPLAAAPGKIIVPKEVTQNAFKKVFMEDFAVLFMFLALIGMFVVSWKGQNWVDKAEPRCDVGLAQYCGYAYFWISVLYSCAYYCCSCCSASVTIKKEETDCESLE